jgi:hypothetical protein
MALTIVRDKDPMTQGDFHVIGDLQWRHGTITWDASYPAGGEPVTAAMFGFNTLFELLVFGTGAEVPVYNKTTSKVLLYTADGTVAADTSDQSAVVTRYMAIGR